MRTMTSATLFAAALACGCGDDGPSELFTPKPECKGDPIETFAGTHPQVISKLEIGATDEGFDLNGDGKPDNKLGAASDIARGAIADALANYEIIIPIEMYDTPALAADQCVKFGVYLGAYVRDDDGDGAETAVRNGDCNDGDASINRGAAEVAANGKDDDCDGLADEGAENAPSTDTMDRDGDGQTIAAGDCDDTSGAVKQGAAEVCGDGLDNDCDGMGDRSGGETATACSPFDATQPVDIALDPLSLDASGGPVIAFKDGTITSVDGGFRLDAGPSLFAVSVPVTDGVALDLKITGATIQADLEEVGGAIAMRNARLGGVIDARTADGIRGLEVDQIGLTPENSLLDATFANILGTILALPKASAEVQAKYADCRTPDIDLDLDGLEAFCDSNADADPKAVDICIDGDGTEVADMLGPDGQPTFNCTDAMVGDKPRFVDGISVLLKFDTSPIKAIKPPL